MGYDKLRAGRVSIPNQIYFITATSADRMPWFQDLYLGRLVVREMRTVHEAGAVDSLAWVLMPDHVHWLLALGQTCTLSEVMRSVKGRSSRMINTALKRTGPVWQRGFHDHALRREEDIKAIARYIVANPLRAGLVCSLKNYSLWDTKWV